MKLFRLVLLVSVAFGGSASLSFASPTMIRLGYSDCATCHISPQGAGMLTTYGKGVDEAQSLRAQEVHPIDTTKRRVIYDVRFVAASQLADSLAPGAGSMTASTFRLQTRSSVRLNERHRMSYAFGLESPTLSAASQSAANPARFIAYKALWEYRPKENVELAVGRDEMPTGIGLPDPQAFIRSGNDAGDTAYPTQVKLFWWTKRLQLTPYAFAPGGDEPEHLRQYGAGMLAGLDVWKQRAIVGVSTRSSHASSFDRRSVGGFARLGFGKWGVLAEHDLTSKSTANADTPATRYLAGHTQVFYAPREWLVTSLAAEHLVIGAAQRHTYRLTPGVQMRISDNLTVILNTRDAFTGATAGRSRTYSVQVAVKTVE